MVCFKKILIFAYIGLLIVHIIRSIYYDESLTSFALGCIGMILMILSMVLPKKNKNNNY